ncbi:HNH endonuclease [Nocardia fluminea]|uniref:HNH endonuclease n=1 Tax=Nocardia fluminea TaxID=134984 RepID=UPI00340347BD
MHRPFVSRCYADLLTSMPESDRLEIAAKIDSRSWWETEPNALTGTPCRVWTGELASNGYALIRVHGRQAWPVHRVALALSGRYDPPELVSDHVCRVRRCVNPDHIELVTNVENVLRGVGLSAENARKICCHRGHLLAGSNVYRNARGNRRCRICHSFLTRRSRARLRAKAAA